MTGCTSSAAASRGRVSSDFGFQVWASGLGFRAGLRGVVGLLYAPARVGRRVEGLRFEARGFRVQSLRV